MSLGDIGNFMDENWHGGQIDGDFFEHPEMDIEETVIEEKKESNKLVWNWKHAITRELMRGKHRTEILSKYKNVIDRFDIKELICNFLDKNQGVLGYFIVDVSNFDDKFKYEDMPQELRECNLYAINAVELREVINRSLVSEEDGSLDGFLNSDDSINEEIYYLDECTGLPAIDSWNGESDDDDERLNSIANLFLGKKWMSLSEKDNFNEMEGKLPYLVSIVKRAYMPKSNSNGNFEDDINDFEVENQELEADSQKFYKDAEVNNIHEQKLDDIGNTNILEKVVLKDIKQRKLDDIGDVSLKKSFNINKEVNPDDYRQDINLNKQFEVVNIKDEVNPADYRQDVDYIKKISQEEIDNTKELGLMDFETDIPDYGFFDDNMTELSDKDYRDDVEFDDMEDFIIEDIRDMEDDEFDYADLSDGAVDLDEMMEDELYDQDFEIDDEPEEVEISNKYDWSW